MENVKEKYIGPSGFYQRAARLAVPSVLQQLLSSSMGIVDTMMVSRIGEVSAVGVASQLESMVATVCFGVMEGVGIFASQFFGAKDKHNLRRAFGLSLAICGTLALIWTSVISFFARPIASFYVKDPAVIESALRYMRIVRFSYLPLCIAFVFNYFFRCIHRTTVPMYIGSSAMFVNAGLNYLLIFGKFGCPQLGVEGAAWGTLIAQCFSVTCYTVYAVSKRVPFIGWPQEMFALDLKFVRPIMRRTYPTIINEAFFTFGSSMYLKAYAQLGTRITDAYHVGNTILRLFMSVCNGLSVATGMILGAELGKNDIDTAKKESRYFLGLAFMLAGALTVIIIAAAHPIVWLFSMEDPLTFATAVGVVRASAVRIAFRLVIVVIFSCLRAGGDSRFLMFLDAGVMWAVGIPLAFFLVNGLGLTNFTLIFLLVQTEQLVRMLIGLQRFSSNRWAVNLTKLVA